MDACPWASTFEKKTRAALGDAQGGSFSDGGSNPPASTRKQLAYLRLAVFLFIVKNVIKIRISDGSIEVLKHFDKGLGSIFKHGDSYYVVKGGSKIYKFNETTDPVLIASGLPSAITGLYVDDNLICFVSNGGYGFYIYDMDTEKYVKKFDLNYPKFLYRISF